MSKTKTPVEKPTESQLHALKKDDLVSLIRDLYEEIHSLEKEKEELEAECNSPLPQHGTEAIITKEDQAKHIRIPHDLFVACIGRLTNPITGGVLDDANFADEAPRFVAQQVKLARLMHAAIMEENQS